MLRSLELTLQVATAVTGSRGKVEDGLEVSVGGRTLEEIRRPIRW